MQNKTKSAFTVVEIITAISILGVIAAVVVSTLFTDKGRQEKINKTLSSNLHANFEQIYQDILNTKCSGKYTITALEDINKDKKIDSADIRDFIVSSYMGEKLSSCDSFVTSTEFIDFKSKMACADISPNGMVGVYYNKSCSGATIKANEEIGMTTRTITDSCGYIAYSLKESKGQLGKDFFVYPLVKRTHKKRTIGTK